jgi:hypothetical protein
MLVGEGGQDEGGLLLPPATSLTLSHHYHPPASHLHPSLPETLAT